MKNERDVLLLINRNARIELARRSLWHYCNLLYPEFYTNDKIYLKDLCKVIESKPKKLMINLAPRTGKSLTITLAETWFIGHNNNERIISVSYNDKLAGRFSKGVRDVIEATRSDDSFVFSDVFNNVKIKRGDGGSQLWSIEGSFFTFLGSGMGSSITGIGSSCLVVDDIVKNSYEAYTAHVLDSHYDFYKNTLLSRLETGGRIIINMTRWCENDLCGRLVADEPDQWTIFSRRIDECTGIMTADEIDIKRSSIDPAIWEANYNQNIIITGDALYKNGFKLFNETSEAPRIVIMDVADKGTDFLAATALVRNGDLYDIHSTFMDSTELADLEDRLISWLTNQKIAVIYIESNNVGNYFSKQLRKRLPSISIRTYNSTSNKEARIKASSWWVQDNIRFHKSLTSTDFYRHIIGFRSKFNANRHDDPEDVMSAIYELFGTKHSTLAGTRI